MNWTTRRRAAIATIAICAGGMAAAPGALARTVLSTGHVDVVSARVQNGRLVSLVKDSTRGVGTTVWRDPDQVIVRVLPKARTTLPAGLGVVGPAGSAAWLIPQVQRDGVIWAGWNTEEVTSQMVRGPISWTLRKVSGPGKLVIFQTGSFGQADILFNSGRRLPQTQRIPLGTHAHGNWAFTRRGTYRFSYVLSVRSASGALLRATSTLTFAVG